MNLPQQGERYQRHDPAYDQGERKSRPSSLKETGKQRADQRHDHL
jgi:hypothetical protein